MKCFDLKTLSYISAWLQIAICIIILTSYSIQLAVDDLESRNDRLDTVVFLFFVIIVLAIPFLIALLVGIKQNRMILVGIFLYAAHALLAFGIIYMLYKFIMGFVHKKEIAKMFLHLLMASMFIGLEFLLTTPIHMLHAKRHSSLPGGEKNSPLKDKNQKSPCVEHQSVPSQAQLSSLKVPKTSKLEEPFYTRTCESHCIGEFSIPLVNVK